MRNYKFISILVALFVMAFSVRANSFTLPVPIGTIERSYVQYKDNDTVTVSSGFGECNGFYWEIAIPEDVDVTVPLAGC